MLNAAATTLHLRTLPLSRHSLRHTFPIPTVTTKFQMNSIVAPTTLSSAAEVMVANTKSLK
jgi:hypothetical protein